MKKYVAVFRSRTDVLSFIENLRKHGVYAIAVQTPKEAKVGCGISAEFSPAGISVAKRLLETGAYPSFFGFFIIEKRGKTVTATRF